MTTMHLFGYNDTNTANKNCVYYDNCTSFSVKKLNITKGRKIISLFVAHFCNYSYFCTKI